MSSEGEFDWKPIRHGSCITAARVDAITARVHADQAKAAVMEFLGKLVSDGLAEWKTRDTGDIELRCRTGETFLLSATTISRLA